MLFDLSDHDTLYRALLDRNQAYEGRVYVGVATTGVFCRLSCPARKPKPENCIFFETAGACIEAGYRPCKRCHPLQPSASADPAIGALLDALDARPDRRWREADVARMGYDPSTVRRSFKRQFGMTFLEMARQRRLREAFVSLSGGDKVIMAQHQAAFESASAFRAAFARLLGCPPGALSPNGLLLADWIPTPLGDMIAVASQTHLHLLEFVDRRALPGELGRLRQSVKGALGVGSSPPVEQVRKELDAFFDGRSALFETPTAQAGSAFANAVWAELRAIPPGETRSYSQIARAIGHPSAIRAVARANGTNQLALVVPCHRVIGADGALTGYGGGLWRKQRLLEIEQRFKRREVTAGAAYVDAAPQNPACPD